MADPNTYNLFNAGWNLKERVKSNPEFNRNGIYQKEE